MKINLKAILAALGIFGLISGTGAEAGTNGTITITTDNIRGGSFNSVDPIIPTDPSALYESGVVRSLYAIPAYDERYIKREEVRVMKYGIPEDPSKIDVIKKDTSVKKYALPELDKPKVKKSKKYNDAPVAKYALPEFMNENKPVRNFNENEPVLLKYALPEFMNENKPVKNNGENNDVKLPENNEINTQDPNGENFVPLLKYAIPYFPDKKEQNNEK